MDRAVGRLEFIMAAPAAMDRIDRVLVDARIWSMYGNSSDSIVYGVERLVRERDAALAALKVCRANQERRDDI